jgi:hypothetical protein
MFCCPPEHYPQRLDNPAVITSVLTSLRLATETSANWAKVGGMA